LAGFLIFPLDDKNKNKNKNKIGSDFDREIMDISVASAHASSPSFPGASRQQKLQLYGLFKQATKGTTTGLRPGVFDVVGRAKFDAWAACKVRSNIGHAKYVCRRQPSCSYVCFVS
jgi:acyl-CoA-binding protein